MYALCMQGKKHHKSGPCTPSRTPGSDYAPSKPSKTDPSPQAKRRPRAQQRAVSACAARCPVLGFLGIS